MMHRLVAIAFLGQPPSLQHEVNHKNGHKSDNRVDNLEWVTESENKIHAIKVLGRKQSRGEEVSKAVLTESDVIRIRGMFNSGMKYGEIALFFNVHRVQISRIVRRVQWKHVK